MSHQPPAPRKWQRLSRRLLFENPWYRVSQDRYRLPAGGEGEYTYVDIPGSTMVVPQASDGSLRIVRQYRYLMQRESLEFPAGGLKAELTPLANAQMELREEAGLTADTWIELGRFAPYNGVSNEYCHVFLARDLTEVQAAPEPTEEMEVVRTTVPQLEAALASGELWDGMTVASLSLFTTWLRRHEPGEPLAP